MNNLSTDCDGYFVSSRLLLSLRFCHQVTRPVCFQCPKVQSLGAIDGLAVPFYQDVQRDLLFCLL